MKLRNKKRADFKGQAVAYQRNFAKNGTVRISCYFLFRLKSEHKLNLYADKGRISIAGIEHSFYQLKLFYQSMKFYFIFCKILD